MPPPTTGVALPTDRGQSATDFLEAYGLCASVPPIRASDFDLLNTCRFLYYLTRRLGLVQSLRWSKALNRGSWLHKRWEFFGLPDEEGNAAIERSFNDRVEELKAICAGKGWGQDSTQTVVDREKKDYQNALSWYGATAYVPIGSKPPLQSFLRQPHWRLLASEPRLVVPGSPARVCQPDAIYYHEGQNAIWLLDLKSCAESPLLRLSTCPLEFQTLHYLAITKELLEGGLLRQRFNLPIDVTLGGMMHAAVQKPTIEFGMLDRPYTLDTSPFKSGPRKGQPRNEKLYGDEPIYEMFLQRCKRWYMATDEYSHLAETRQVDPAVNISFSEATQVLDEDGLDEYHARIDFISEWAKKIPRPQSFFRSQSHLRAYNRESPYLPFYVCPVKDWPEIILRSGFIQQARDEDLTPDAPMGILDI